MSNDNNVIRLLGGKPTQNLLSRSEIKNSKLSTVFINNIAVAMFVVEAIAITVFVLLSFAIHWVVRNILQSLT